MEKHLLQAAERGDAEAQFNLGIMYENGLDDSRYAVEGSRPEAMRWLLAAAEQGLPRAQIKLAEIYAGEPEIPENSVKACGWYLLATASLRGAHLEKAQSAYQRACFHLTPSQIAEVRLFARGWKPKAWAIPAGSAGNARERASVISASIRSANGHSEPDRPGFGGIHHAFKGSIEFTRERSGLAGRGDRRGDGHRRWCRRAVSSVYSRAT